MVSREKSALEASLEGVYNDLAAIIMPSTPYDELHACQLELSNGVGGLESGLFTAELYRMYELYAQSQGWIWKPIRTDWKSGSLARAVVSVSGEDAYTSLRFESGTHAVKRVPLTDPTRIHTSTASIIVMPEPENVRIF